MPITYIITIDKTHDGNFSTNITADVIDLKWRLGLAQPYDSIADYSHAEITVRNPSGAYSPERNSLDTGTRVRIQSNDGTITRTQFTGYIRHIDPSEGEWGEKTAVIHLQDCQPWLDDSAVIIAPQVDVTADTVIDTLLNEAVLRRAVIGGYCIIDIEGYNLIDSVSIFSEENIARSLETGKTRFAYVGDWWQETVPARQAIRELVESERGRFYINRDGEAVFLNRHYTLVNKTLSATFDDDMQSLDYSYGDNRLNRLTLIMTPREVGDNNTILWQLDSPQRIAPETQVTLNLPFINDLNQPIGMLELDSLTATFNRKANGTGKVITENVRVDMLHLGFTSMQVQVSNIGTIEAYLTELVIRGKPLYQRDPLEIVVSDGEGMHIYGLQSAILDLPALSNIEIANAFAQYDLARRKHPSGIVRSLTANTRDNPAEALAVTLFDRIRISETQTGHSTQDYFVIAEDHHVSKGGTQHTVKWTLEPADSTRFVIIDDSEIDDIERLITPY